MNIRLQAMLEHIKTLTPEDQPDTYVFRCDEMIKVGTSKGWRKRLSDYRSSTGLPWERLYVWPSAGFVGERMIQLELEDRGLSVGSNCHHTPELFYYDKAILGSVLDFIGADVQ